MPAESAYAHLGNALQILLSTLGQHDHVDRDTLQAVVDRIEAARIIISQHSTLNGERYV